jgi:Ca2+-binding EF-hand superfamily protein|uniref:EF-hand domain-containing protein n=1 Tax=Eutreptiella gymnastica TaxID=73025 RepID=A0A7S4LLN0_9EUGL|eukprot:CAMPEP_0174294508 /NCGR_PEP_ID=MMETSP0809-20121228/41887_1 /TAXON_ID=73025 ORGANISM="Eutreptiella gymnastica-like, Strain CCMP1594" /NCGR_SAMPLE_ID=MMETSP0809 /ASSEMBLY_ACC=CAM_ASM_000658 /LENGTH=259 /DNA_ID=CAMNT_0015396027 /DNA_START=29 /DNA_END=808 /DNA_ORIENTATION=-
MADGSAIADGTDYLQAHQIHFILEHVVAQLVKTKPSDPLLYTIELLETIQLQEDAMHYQLKDTTSAKSLEYLRRQFKANAKHGQLTRDSFTEVLEKALHPDTPPEQRKAQLRRLNALFSIFVKDKCDEKVEIDELSSGLRTLFAGTDDEKLEFAFQGLDTDGDGCISKEEFLKHFKSYFQAMCAVDGIQMTPRRWKNMEEHFMVVFRATDTDSSGTLDLQEFRKAVKEDPDHPFSLLWSTLPKPKEKPAATGNLPVAGK